MYSLTWSGADILPVFSGSQLEYKANITMPQVAALLTIRHRPTWFTSSALQNKTHIQWSSISV